MDSKEEAIKRSNSYSNEVYHEKIRNIIASSPRLSLRQFHLGLPQPAVWTESHFDRALVELRKFGPIERGDSFSLAERVCAVYQELKGKNQTHFMHSVIRQVDACTDAEPMRDGTVEKNLDAELQSLVQTRAVRDAWSLWTMRALSASFLEPIPE
jgi:hypothetical protein